jgi:cell division protein FtsI (penicillin-binding protein 3)
MINSRVLWLLIGVSFFFILLIVKLFDIQILKNEESIFYAKRQQNKTENIKAERGLIYDRNETLLVYNRNDISVYLDNSYIALQDRQAVANKLSSLFKNKRSYYLKMMREKSSTVCIEKKVSNEKSLLVKNLKLPALYYREDPTRIYHYNSLASHIIGYVDDQLNGVDGIEGSLNSTLKGEDGIRLIERSAGGKMITVREEDTKQTLPGLNVHLTIDKKLQAILEEELKNGVKNFNASSAAGILMNPNNGEILALANVSDYDPNNYSEYDDFQRKNRCITDTYEPGSTMKGITLAALLDQNLCSETECVNVENGSYKFKDRMIRDAHPNKILSVKGILEQSSNIGMSKLIQRIDDETLYKYLRGFGFGTTTGIELPGEVKGTLTKPSEWSLVSKAYLSFGYEISVTAIQLVTAFSALINGGVVYQPQIVKKLLNPSGETNLEYHPREVRRIISQQTSDRMRNLLASVVNNGTGQKAKLDIVTVGGKTGTSKILENGKYSLSNYNSSFVGFFPVENPVVVCLIVLYSPKVGGYGGLVAAPIFKEVTKRMLISLQESYQKDSQKPKQESQDVHFIKTKNVEDVKTLDIKSISEDQPDKFNIELSDMMPDLKNYSLREALVILTKLGLRYKVIGSGKISSQSIQPGMQIKKGSVCKLICSEIKGSVIAN